MKKIFKILWFKGRINRLEYTLSVVVTFSLLYLVSLITPNPNTIVLLLGFYPYYSQGAKRCQDRGLNGLWIFNPANFIFNFTEKGTEGENFYGNQPEHIFESL